MRDRAGTVQGLERRGTGEDAQVAALVARHVVPES
jgi:hypothetical protein